jgi:hypothetical protein
MHLKHTLGKRLNKSTISRLLGRHGWCKLAPRPIHPKASKEEQEAFTKTFAAEVASAVAARPPEDTRPVLKMAQDEGRFGRISIPKRAWAPPGVRPTVHRQVIRQSSYVYAAMAPEQGLMTSLVLPSSNTEMMNLFLAYVAEVFADYFIAMQTDQAGWHRAKELSVPENSRLILQPAYSPELNPVEHIWEKIREKPLHNLSLPSLDKLIERLCQALSVLTEKKDRLRSLTFFPHFRCTSSEETALRRSMFIRASDEVRQKPFVC